MLIKLPGNHFPYHSVRPQFPRQGTAGEVLPTGIGLLQIVQGLQQRIMQTMILLNVFILVRIL